MVFPDYYFSIIFKKLSLKLIPAGWLKPSSFFHYLAHISFANNCLIFLFTLVILGVSQETSVLVENLKALAS